METELKEKLKNKIKLIHRIPPEDQLDVETEVFLDYFATEIIAFLKETGGLNAEVKVLHAPEHKA